MQCPTCAHENPSDARYCAQCGSPLLDPAASEERKVVSILFCDLVNSTALAGSKDPEEWRAVLGRYFASVRKEVEHHGGTVEKFIGDAVMAVFGLPAAHEDDPERAVRAAHRMLNSLQGFEEITARIGIATGEVIANPAASEKGEFLVTGDAVNLAARLQAAAPPGTILVDARTWRNVFRFARGESRGTLALKGFARPVEVWEVRAVTDAPSRRGQTGLRAPLLGRNEELALLTTLLQRVVRDARTALTTVIGEAGVGKSRLFEEFRARLPAEVRVLKGRCLPYGTSTAFSALADALKREAGIADTDPQDAAREKLTRMAATALAGDSQASRLIDHVSHALGLAEGAATFPITRQDVFAALARLLVALAGSRALVVSLEDIHWADDSLLDLLDDLTRRPPAARLLLICLARPLLLERRPDWSGGRRNVSSVYLDPLPPEESRRLVNELLQANLPTDVTGEILGRAEGNPFFVEETLRMLIDEGQLTRTASGWEMTGADFRIPDTVQGVIAARLDQLPPVEKQTAQNASVVGRIFWLQPLQRLADDRDMADSVMRLEQKELVAQRHSSTISEDREYIFRHILIRDVAYGTIPKVQRAAKHRVVAEWLAAVTRDRADEFADLLAYHYEQAQLWRQAFGYVLRVADRAYALDTYRTALTHYRHAATLAAQAGLSDDEKVQLFTQRGWTRARLAEYAPALADLTQARDLANVSSLGAWEVSALLGIAWVQGHQGDYLANAQTTREALAIARGINAPRLIVDCLLDLGSCFHNLEQVHEGLAAFEEAAGIGAQIGYERGTVHAMRGLAMQDVGQLQDAIQYHRRAVARTREIGERRIEASNLNYLAGALIRAGAAREALSHAEAAAQLSVASGDRYREQYSRRWIAYACLQLGTFGRAMEESNAALEIARSLKDNEVIGYVGAILTELYAQLGDQQNAAAHEQEALEAIRRATTMPARGIALGNIGTARLLRGDLAGAREIFHESAGSKFVLWGPPDGHWGLGMVGIREGRLDDAAEHAHRLEALAQPRGMRSFVAKALWIRAGIARARGGQAELGEAITLAKESEELPLLRSLLVLAGAPDAQQVADALAGSIPDPRLRESFARSAPL